MKVKNNSQNKKNVIVLFGGKSVEHDISIITGVQTLNALDKTLYNIYPIYISKIGLFYTSPKFFNIKTFTKQNFLEDKSCQIVNILTNSFLIYQKHNKQVLGAKIDFAFLATHGALGENGALQGLLDMCGICYSSPNVFSSGVCMNKLASKILLKNSDINVTNYVLLLKSEYSKNNKTLQKQVLKNLKFPLIVKPCSLGSSVGITYCKNKISLENAISFAFLFDNSVLVEEAVENLREVNLSLLGNSKEVETSVIEEVNIKNNFLTFENKYLDSSTGKGMQNMARIIPAKLESELENKIKEYGKLAYKLLNCKGIVRIDFLINNKSGMVYLNEVNTIPGSLSNYLWNNKYTFSELLNKTMEYCLEQQKIDNSLITNFTSNVLANFEKANKMGIKK